MLGTEWGILGLRKHKRLKKRLFAGQEIPKEWIVPAFTAATQRRNASGGLDAVVRGLLAQLAEHFIQGPVDHVH